MKIQTFINLLQGIVNTFPDAEADIRLLTKQYDTQDEIIDVDGVQVFQADEGIRVVIL